MAVGWMDEITSYLVGWFLTGTVWIAKAVFNAALQASGTTPGADQPLIGPVYTPGIQQDLTTSLSVVEPSYRAVATVAMTMSLLFLIFGVISGILSASPTLILRRAIIDMPKFVLTTVVMLSFSSMLVVGLDAVNDLIVTNLSSDASSDLVAQLDEIHDLNDESGAIGSIVLLVLSGLVILAGLVVWIILTIRTSLIWLLVVISPLIALSMMTPYARAFRKLGETLFAVVLSKTVIIIALLLGTTALSATFGSLNDGGYTSLSTAAAAPGVLSELSAAEIDAEFAEVARLTGLMLAILSLLVLALFSPWLVMSLIPEAEGAATGLGAARGGVTEDVKRAPGMSAARSRIAKRKAGNK